MLTLRAEGRNNKYTVLEVERYYVNTVSASDAPTYKEVDTEAGSMFDVGVEKEYQVIYVMNSEGRTVDVIR